MAPVKTLLALAAAQAVSAHYTLNYPEWRADTMSHEEDSELSQWTYPCAGAEFGAGNFTDWPLDGGALSIELGHHWTYLFINLGLGNDTTDFNITLTPDLVNVTGEGTLCIDKLNLTEPVREGTFGTLQVITLDGSGSSLYNCADLHFTADAESPGNCTTAEDIEVHTIAGDAGGHGDGHSHGSDNSTEEEEGADGGSAAGTFGANMVALTSALALTVGLVMGL